MENSGAVTPEAELKMGILVATVFPLLMLIGIIVLKKKKAGEKV